jgi:uncharacterized membrane protein YgdD (TMEM256/DUF423 family)
VARTWIVLGILSGFLSVAAGAFGAHALRDRLGADLLAIFETGARYRMFHALAFLAVGLIAQRAPSAATCAAGGLFTAGTVLFSGSLYALALTGVRAWGAVTPFGGAAFLLRWIALALAAK